jgi:hypothetical protein
MGGQQRGRHGQNYSSRPTNTFIIGELQPIATPVKEEFFSLPFLRTFIYWFNARMAIFFILILPLWGAAVTIPMRHCLGQADSSAPLRRDRLSTTGIG